MEDARKEFEEALRIYQRFAERDPAQFQPFVDQLQSSLRKTDRPNLP